MVNNLTIEQARTPQERMDFIRFPWQVYRGDPYWVPPLISERVEFLDPQRHPFYEHADVSLFLARRGGEVVGTIAALVNHRHNEFHGEQIGFFGLFEVIEDREVAEALLETACTWVRGQGMKAVRGPTNFSTNEELGLLVSGTGRPVIMMTYNPPYYADFIDGAGFVKAMDLVAYLIDMEPLKNGMQRTARIAEKVKARRGISVRPINMRRFDEEAERVKKLYNSAWEKNWGFVPMTDHEMEHTARGLKQIIDPDLSVFIEKEGEPIGFALILPDVNKALLKAYPRPQTPEWWTMAKLFWHWKVGGRLDTARGYAGGFTEEHRGVGAAEVLAQAAAEALIRKGYRYCEFSWLLETNFMVRRMAEAYGGQLYRTYRIYEKAL
jgi:hypothetical protein